jgi:hypothetical protein
MNLSSREEQLEREEQRDVEPTPDTEDDAVAQPEEHRGRVKRERESEDDDWRPPSVHALSSWPEVLNII